MKKVKIYTWSTCPFCIQAKQHLAKKGIAFEEVVLDGKDEELGQLRQRTGHRTVPQIFIGEQMIGGFTDLMELDAKGQLDKLIEG